MADLEALVRDEKNLPANPDKRQIVINRRFIEAVVGLKFRGDTLADKLLRLYKRLLEPFVTPSWDWPYDRELTGDKGVPVKVAYERLVAAGVLEEDLDQFSAERELERLFRYHLNVGPGYYEGHAFSLPDDTRALKAERKPYTNPARQQ